MFSPLKLASQPDPRELPVAHDRLNRNTQDARAFFHTQTAKHAQFDDAASPRIECRQGIERGVQRNEVAAALRRRDERVAQRHPPKAAATLDVPLAARVIDQDVPHERRGEGEEVRAIPQADAATPHEAHIRLIDERCGLERVTRRLAPHMPPRQLTQIPVDQRHQPLERGLISLSPGQ